MLGGVMPVPMPPMPLMGTLDRSCATAGDHVQRDRLDRRAAIAAVRGFAADVGPRREGVEVDADQRIDRVDQADGVGAAALGGFGDRGSCR